MGGVGEERVGEERGQLVKSSGEGNVGRLRIFTLNYIIYILNFYAWQKSRS